MNFEQQLAEIGCACEQPPAQCHACGPVPCMRPSAMPPAQCQRSWPAQLSAQRQSRSAVGPTLRIRKRLHALWPQLPMSRSVRHGRQPDAASSQDFREKETAIERMQAAHPRAQAPWHASLHSSKASAASEYTACARQAPSSVHAFKGSERGGSAEEPTDCGKHDTSTRPDWTGRALAEKQQTSRFCRRLRISCVIATHVPTNTRARSRALAMLCHRNTGRCQRRALSSCERCAQCSSQRPDGAKEGPCRM
jgi:hypothetical protein